MLARATPGDPAMSSSAAAALPQIIQGGMGVGVSNWVLAGRVAACGQLGVVSGTAVERVLACRLQAGDPDGAMRRFIREAQSTYTSPAIMQFAAQQGIDPAIVVGRLQQVQAVPYHTPLNELKGYYDVGSIKSEA